MSRNARTLLALVVAATTSTLVVALLPGTRSGAPPAPQATPEPSRSHQPPTLHARGATPEGADSERLLTPDGTGEAPADKQVEALVDVTYTLPRPPRGRVWVAADAIFDSTIRRGTPRSLMSWPASHLDGPAEAVLETIRTRRGGAQWEDSCGALLERRDGYTVVIRTTKALHAEIKGWLRSLHWSAVPTRQSIAHELAWMLQRGTRIEREWADRALAALPPAVRDWVEETREDEPASAAADVRVADAPGGAVAPQVHVEWLLALIDRSLYLDLGIDYRYDSSFPFDPKVGGFLTLIDDTQWEVLTRAMAKPSRRVRKLGARKETRSIGAPSQLVMDEQAVLHLRTTLSKDRRYITVEGRAHAMDSGVLVFAPSFTVKVPDTGAVWISVRDVIVGNPSPERELGIMLRITASDATER